MRTDLAYGDVWLVDFDPIIGHEQGGKRPGVLVSRSDFNQGAARLVVVIPLTTRARELSLRTRLDPPNGGLTAVSYAMPDMIRSVSHDRLVRAMGSLSPPSLREIAEQMRMLLNL